MIKLKRYNQLRWGMMEVKKYYDMLYAHYGTKDKVLTELINLEAILNLPKGTEHYMSDVHGESEAFNYILRNGAGNIKEKIRELFGYRFSAKKTNQMALLIYYPEVGIETFTKDLSPSHKEDWYQATIVELVELIKYAATKYTRSKLRKALPAAFIYVIEELIYVDEGNKEKDSYYREIIERLIRLGQAGELIGGLCQTIQRLVVDHLHLVGDIFDRGPAADKVMDTLLGYHSLDIQWGNHDILWLGAYSGSAACLMTLLRIAARYNYLYELEAAYGLNLRPLFSLANRHYGDNPKFLPLKRKEGDGYEFESLEQLGQVHQALAILQFKLEGQIIKRRPDFGLDARLLLDKVASDRKTVRLDGMDHQLEGACFQTVDPACPYELTEEEAQVVGALLSSYQNSEKMGRHMGLLLEKGSMYLEYNGHLLFHGCIPVDEEGEFLSMDVQGTSYKGKGLLQALEAQIRLAAKYPSVRDDYATDLVWYTWLGEKSPLFGKDKMTTFERYFIADKSLHKERQNPYFTLREQENFCQKILAEFGIRWSGARIINGHTPVKAGKGESPIKANGKMIVIDGGMSKSYQKSTGIAGYTLLNNSYGFQLVTHQPFVSVKHLFETGEDRISVKRLLDRELSRTYIKNTTIGGALKEQAKDLENLLEMLG